MLLVHDDMIADMEANEKLKPIHYGLLYLHGLTLRIMKKKIVGQIFKRSFESK